jgi:hypothetical protein
MSEPDFSVLHRGGTRTRIQMGCIGCGTWGLGGFMVALHAIPLDPSTRNMGTVMVCVLYGFALLFMAVGVLMVGIAVMRSGRDIADLESILRDDPQSIASARRMVANRYGIQPADGETALGQHQALVESTTGRTWVFNTTAAQVTAILTLVDTCCPGVRIDGR